VQAGLGIKGYLISKISNAKRASRGAQMAEHLPSPKFKPQYHKKKKDDSGIGVCDKDYITNQQEEIKTELIKQVNSIRTGHRNGQ
jgi:hypothetical protein